MNQITAIMVGILALGFYAYLLKNYEKSRTKDGLKVEMWYMFTVGFIFVYTSLIVPIYVYASIAPLEGELAVTVLFISFIVILGIFFNIGRE